jgi:hypothetical protein
MSAIAIQSNDATDDQELIDSLTGLIAVINMPINKGNKKKYIELLYTFLSRLSNTKQSSVVTSFALDVVNRIEKLIIKEENIPQNLEVIHEKLIRNLKRANIREAEAAAASAASAASAAATNAARCTGRGCFSRFTRSIKRKIGLHTTPTPPTSPIVAPYNSQHALAPFRRRTSKSPGQSRTPSPPPHPSLPGAVMPLGGSRRVRRRTKHGQRVKHRRRTIRRRF